MDRKTKQESLNFLLDRLSNLNSIVFTNFKGLSAQDMSDVRSLLREKGGEYKVVKNTIALMAIEKANKDTQQFVSGACAIAFLPENPIGSLKTLINFSKEHEALVLKGGVIEGEMVDSEKLKQIAALPERSELLTSVVVNLKAPVSNMVSYLHQMIFGLVNVINSIKNSPDVRRGMQDGGSEHDKEGSR